MERIDSILPRVISGSKRWQELLSIGFAWNGVSAWYRGDCFLSETTMFRMSEDAWQDWLRSHQRLS